MELANILELIHAVSDSDLTEFNLQDDTLNISMSKEKTIVQLSLIHISEPTRRHITSRMPSSA